MECGDRVCSDCFLKRYKLEKCLNPQQPCSMINQLCGDAYYSFPVLIMLLHLTGAVHYFISLSVESVSSCLGWKTCAATLPQAVHVMLS